ncbi:helix-turn-helix transcriptional regulator [Sphingosinicella sp. BN140058]|uniref:helix-turn-helix transcriptional regulator n=1 Tax=Sphingosinicella sp. BN140058 TaxID=1892855 RepID=UPI0010104699|nr:helix-turn-helix transcriptional regulator [Sphingosinicella sp. BN140058]QAY76311.1 LuxR family transcriptional regulator [Sphingosinicella sp. BN140058]
MGNLESAWGRRDDTVADHILAQDMLAAVGLPAMLLDAAGRVIAIGPLMRPLTRSGRILVTASGPGAGIAGDDRVLEALIGTLVDADASGVAVLSARRILHGAAGAAPLLVEMLLLPRREQSSDAGAPRYLLTIRGGGCEEPMIADVLREAFRLTASEVEVAMMLGEGRSRSAIAEHRGVSVDTIKFQLKAIFAKLGVKRETELVAKMGRLFRG